MNFAWPLGLIVLSVLPLLGIAYWWQRRKKRRSAVRFSHVALIKAALPTKSRWRRVLPMALFFLGLGGLGVASARPQASIVVPTSRTSIILAIDVSRSMCATDVEPNRLVVAQAAARAFIERQPAGTRIGIVSFAGAAQLLVEPTNDKPSLIAAIEGLTTARGTAIGAATLAALDSLAAINSNIAPVGIDPVTGEANGIGDAARSTDVPPTDAPSSNPPSDSPSSETYVPDIVVLLTDGANTRGIEPVDAAKEAAARKVRVYTIGFGTTNPTSNSCTAQQLGADNFSDGTFNGLFGGGGSAPPNVRRFMTIDEPTLQEVARLTGGKYYRAADANQLGKVFANLPKDVILQREQRDVSSLFAALASVWITLAIGLSLWWNRSG
jgi:Ca-activated chloride channel homolog